MAQRVLRQALDVVDGFCRIRVAYKFRVQIPWMVRRLERKAEVVHGEHVFEKLRFLEVADAAGLPRGVELMRGGIGTRVKIVVVLGLVDAHAPQNNRWVIPVT